MADHISQSLVCGGAAVATLAGIASRLNAHAGLLISAAGHGRERLAFVYPEAGAADGSGMIELGAKCGSAILVVAANDGISPQGLNHGLALHVLGIKNVTFAVEIQELDHLSHARYEALATECRDIAKLMQFDEPAIIPVSALAGSNVTDVSAEAGWYDGPSLAGYVFSLSPARPAVEPPMRMMIGADGAGHVISGSVSLGDKVAILPAGRVGRVSGLTCNGKTVGHVDLGQTAALALEDGSSVQPGDVVAPPEQRPEIADQVAAHIVWSGSDPLLPGRPYVLRCGAQKATASVTALKYRINAHTLEHVAARQLDPGETGFCNISMSRPIVFDPFETGRETGRFELADSITGKTVGAGLIRFGLRRAENVHWQALSIDRAARAAAKLQQPCCLWFTGLSGSGKSTIANLLERKLHSTGRHTYILDGDNVRHGLNRDLGFADADRVENIRRVAEVAKLMVDAGLIVIVSFISPFRAERRMARELFQTGEFLEVFVETPIEVCEARDPKGLYAKARKGLIRNFTGIDSDYEQPEQPELKLDTTTADPADLAERLLADLAVRGLV